MNYAKISDEYNDPHGSHSGKEYDRTQESKYRVKNVDISIVDDSDHKDIIYEDLNNELQNHKAFLEKENGNEKKKRKYKKGQLKRDYTRNQIYKSLQESAKTGKELTKIFNRTQATISYHLSRMLEKKLIKKIDGYRYKAISSQEKAKYSCKRCVHDEICKIQESFDEINKILKFTQSENLAQICVYYYERV